MSTASPFARFAATFAIAGFAALGSVAIAPAASAAQPAIVQDGPASVVEKTTGNGPDAFIILEHGKKPIFFCDADKPKKQKNNCEPLPVLGGDRF